MTRDTKTLIPEGYALVPVRPTIEMIEAYCQTFHRHGFHAWVNASTIWPAMLAAAKSSPALNGGDR